MNLKDKLFKEIKNELKDFVDKLTENELNNLTFLIDFLKLSNAKCNKLIKDFQSIDDGRKISILSELIKSRKC